MGKSRAYASVPYEEQLVNYLGGQNFRAMGQVSNFAAQIHALELMGPMRPCLECGGQCEPEPRPGCGFVPADPELYERQVKEQQNLWLQCGLDPPADLDLWTPINEVPCEKCESLGWLPAAGWYQSAGWVGSEEITAKPTVAKHAAGTLLDDVALEMYGRVSRWLHKISRADPVSAAVLAALFGPDNKRGRTAPWLDVWPLTIAGVKLKRTIDELDQLRTEIRLMTIPHPQRNLVRQAEEQAAALVERACNAWESAVEGSGRRPSTPPPNGGFRAAA